MLLKILTKLFDQHNQWLIPVFSYQDSWKWQKYLQYLLVFELIIFKDFFLLFFRIYAIIIHYVHKIARANAKLWEEIMLVSDSQV